MLRITLLAVGQIKTSWIADGCMQYTQRLHRSISFDVIEVPASKQKDPARQRAEECDRLLQKIESAKGAVWVLDETGVQHGSVDLTKKVQDACAVHGSITFVLGGAYGLDDRIRSAADKVVSLSAMTYPHELCRLVLLEQLYRASEVAKGSGYHH